MSWSYYHNDPLGSPLAASDEYGNELWAERYRPFGDRVIEDAKAVDNRMWYNGKPQDSATGLSYYGARYYDPVLGRFMAIDPVNVQPENVHSFNRYAYANNNPYKFVDPDGRAPILFAVLALVALFGADVAIDTALALDVPFDSGVTQAVNVIPGPVSGPTAGAKLGLSFSKGGAKTVTKSAGKEIGILRDAAKGKGNFGLGSGSRVEADKLGNAWVGNGSRVASDGKTLVSKDRLRVYRPPSAKPNNLMRRQGCKPILSGK